MTLENQWLYANSAKSAAKHDRTHCLNWILGAGVDVDTTTKSGNTLLHLAAYHGNESACQLLLEKGSDRSRTNHHGECAEQAARTSGSIRCAELIEAWPNLSADQLEGLDVATAPRLPLSDQEQARILATATNGDSETVAAQQGDQVNPKTWLDTDLLLNKVLEHAKTAVQIQAKQSLLGRERLRVDELCQEAHEAFARAYMVERMLIVESLRGTPARDIPTPKNFKEAVASDFADYWNEAIMTEIRNLESFGTWDWVPRPRDRKLVDSTWTFRVKANQKGEVDRMKARLCARGYREIWGQDYVETHAPVTCLTSWRACMALAAQCKRKIAVLDIKSAYLMADIKEDIYLSPPEGLKVPAGKEGYVLKLRRSLYGLKQAGRYWNQLLSQKMKELGLRQSVADPCLFLNDEGGSLMTINVHVDDCCITYDDERKYQSFRRRLEACFQISKSDDSNTFLGMVIERLDPAKYGDRGPVYIHQAPYAEDVLHRFKHHDCKPAPTPAEPGIKLSKTQMPTTDAAKAAMKNIPYRQLVGALLYLANCTRPDLAQAVSSCARFGSNPGAIHWTALKRVLRYLSGTRALGLVFGRQLDVGVPLNCVHGYVDGDWGGDADDRRSTTGYVYLSYGGPICWRSKKQSSTALSSCESEYMAASEAAKEAIWLTRLYKSDLKIEDVSLETRGDLTEKEYQGAKPLTVFEDNVGCISLSKNPVMHRSSKHIEIRYHFVRERVQDGSLKLVYIPSSENLADILTKSTRKHTFLYLRDKMMCDPRQKNNRPLGKALALRVVVGRERKSRGAVSRPLRVDASHQAAKDAAFAAASAAEAANDAALVARFEVACMGPATWDLSDIPVTWNYDQTWVGGSAPTWLPVNMKWSSATAFATQLRRDPLYREGVAPEYLVVRPGKVSGPYNRFRWPHGYGDWRRRLYTVTWEGQSMREVAHHFRIDPARLQMFNADMWTAELIPLDWHMPRGTSVWVPTPWSLGDHTDSDWNSDESTEDEENKEDAQALGAQLPIPANFSDYSNDSGECCCPWDPNICLALCDKPPFFSDSEEEP